MGVFKEYAEYYNAFYEDKEYKAEAVVVDSIIKKYGSGIEKILTFGCGTGSYEFEFNKLGYQVEGIDISKDMVNIAKKRAKELGIDIVFSAADIREYQSSNKADAVISLFHVMSYQNSNQDIVSAIKSARQSIEEGGLFVFDTWYGPGVLTDRPSIRVKEVEYSNHSLVRIARPTMYAEENRVSVEYDIISIDNETGNSDRITEIHNMRYFFKPEMEYYLNQNGFMLLDCLDCSTLSATDYNSWTCFFVARAI